ncbi:non-ribosomal peptide synthetase, partial [Myxococcus virescens]
FHRVPIGRPVANTVLYVLDTHGQPAPVGIPGELHIGGVQVGRGYWQRPQLTAERFIPDAFSGIPGARLYRTGDVARWLPDGTLEYLGRADFQVKLRGFRIELGEVETALAADRAVRDSVVLAREDSTGDQRLVAYVVLDDAAAAQEVDASSQWQAIYDEAYARETTESEDPTFNIVGWEDSYTGESLPPAQMREWVDTTVAQILGFQPKRVLELGCGTGLLLYRLAPRCEAYWGVDFARPALDRIERQRERMGGALDSVHLLHRSVDDFSGLEPGSFDTVVINSVVQYFSSPEFLLDVLRGAVRVLKPGGRVFLGDVRSLELLEAFRASVRLHRTAGPVATSQFAYRVQRDILAEKELVLSPAFFTALPERIPGIQRVEVLPKHGRYDNELSRFRYEVILHVGDAAKTPVRRTKPDWVDGAGLTLDGLREQLSARPGLLAVRGLPNARVLESTRLVELLSATPPPTVAGLREALRDWPGPRGVEPEDLYVLGSELGYEVRVSWASAHRDGALDVVFARPDEVGTLDLSPEPKQVTSWDGLASDPLRGARSAQAVSRLRDALAAKLPPHMVPSAFVVLPALPLSPNGKVDRKALPAPEAERLGAADAFIAPRTPTEEKVARIFGEILGQSRVGANDDFFALGGHSLLATQVVVRVRAQLNTEISLRTLFDAPTVARLAERIESQAQLADAPGVPALVPLERGPSAAEGLAASFAQQRLWFLEQLHPGQAAYNLPAALRLTGPLDVEALRRTFLEVVRRHEAVRTTFVTREGQPVQRIHPAPAEWPLPEEDLRGLEPEARDAALQARMAEEAHHAFDLEKGPLLRTVLLRTGADAHVLLLCMHHIISDGWSVGVLVREVAALYGALSQRREAALPALSVQYADYAAWQRRVLEGPALAPQLDWWRSRLEGAPSLELPTDHARPAVRSGKGASYFFTLSSEQVAGLERVASAHNATLYMVLMAGWQALLARYSGQTDFCVGTSVAHRTRPELEGLIGFFVNTLALRANVDGDPRFDDLLARVREESLAAFANQDVPFDRLVEVLGGQRDLSRTPLFQAAFVLQNAPMQPPTLPGMVVDVLHTGTDTARFDVTALLVERGGRLEGELEYSLDLFTPETARRMVEHFQRLLRGVVEDASRRISAVPLWSEAERHEVLVAWNDTAAPYPADTTVHQCFTEQALRTPQAIAVEHEGRSLTYAELDARSNQLAHHLRSLGLGAESRVGVFLHRGLDLLVGLLGILKAGGAYVPLDPSYPAQRLAFMAEDSGVAAILTESALEDELPAGSQLIVVLDEEWARIERQPSTPVTGGLVSPEQLAYITYTSGSTGMPKGVAIPHRGVVRLLIGSRFVDLGPSEVVLQLAPLAFDASTLEIWGALLHGARLVLYPQRTPDLAELGQALVRHQVSVLWLTAALFEQMQQHQPEALGTVRQLLAGGDVLPAPRVRERLAQGVGLVNGYGPTEGTTFTACHRMAPGDAVGDSVSIGRPIANTQVYVLDSEMQAVPVGVPGEVLIGGDGLARGYLGQPALTAERFVPNPFGSPGARLYRSGDRARWQADGTLQFLGRVDFQVKLRGFRIELGEVEAALRNHSAVETAIAVVREDIPGDRRLVAYVTPENVDTASVREHLRQRLPEYMVPNAVVALSTLPLSPNGKVDRKALPAPDLVGLGAEDFVAPRTELEQQLAVLFSEVLGLERTGLNDDFFELGGHSLLATQVVTRLRAQLGVDLPLRTFFEAPTVARLAARLESAPRTSTLLPLEPLPRPAQGEATFDVSFAQQRLWFIEQLHPGQFTYNVPAALQLKGRLDEEALRRTFLEVVRRHEAVRTTFVMREGQPAQRIHPAPAEWPLPVEDLSGLEPEARDAAAQARMVEEAHRAFDLEKGPLLRTVLLRTGPDVHVLLLSMHHIISDGWSMGVLVREVAALYESLSQGRDAVLPVLTVQYADYAAWQRRVLEGPALTPQLDWWRSRLEGAPTLELPTDHPRPAVRTLRGATHTFTLPPSLVAGLERVASAHNATLYMVLMAGWQALLARYSGQTDFCVGTPVAHRSRPELEGLIGFFVNTLALRANVDGDPRFEDLLARVREESLAAFANQDVPFDRLVEVMGGQRDLSRTPLFQAAFVLQNAPMQPPTLPGLVVDVLRTGTDTARFDVSALLVERGGRLEGELEYSLDLFTPETARRIVEHFQRLLEGVVEDASRRISAVPLWSEAERHEVLVAWNDTAAPYPADTTVHQRFMEQARRTPERVAVTFEGRSLTYAELDARSNQLARHLVSLGLGPEARIGVCASRGLELVIGVLGALKAGGCYVPLDPSWPVKRLEHATSTARLSAVLTWQSLLPSLEDGPWHVVALDADAADIARQSPEAVQVPVFPEGLAFATFTSGSTGTPKGVAVPHRGLLRLSEGSRFLTQAPEEVTLQLAPVAFDVSSIELWGTLLHGGKLVVYPPGTPEPDAVARLIVEHKVSWLVLATSLFDLLQQHQPEVLARVPNLLMGGEAMPAPRARERLARGGALTNGYGPTECSTMATRHTLSPGDSVGRSVPIGRPIDNTEVYVLDPALRPVPVGVPGELCLGGPGLARGYLNRPDLTAERFVPHPFSAAPGARLYRTGDRVRWSPDGVLEFLGRLDHQVKVRGFRIELGEIEAVLRAHPSVVEATAVVREDASGSNRVVAYVVPPQADVAPLREYLHQHLPDYMVPSAFVGLDAFPLTPNGKVDRKALPAPDLGLGAADYVEPRTELEQQLAALFREALGLERVGLNDDFFLMGGHSLLATQVVTRLRAQLGVDLPLRTFFEAPTVARLAARLESAPRTGTLLPLESLPRPAQGEATFDVSFAQRRLWFIEQLHPGQVTYNMPAALRLTGRLDEEALRRTFLEVVRRHEAVRTTFVTREGQPVQRIHPAPAEWPLPVEDLSGLEPDARDAAVQVRIAEEAHHAFDLKQGPLLRTVLLRTGPDVHVLLLCMHHIISDGWSMGVLVREVAALYEALSQGRESPLPALTVQYADYAVWQRRVLEGPALAPQLAWWRSRLEGVPTLELPTDHVRPAVSSAKGTSYFFSLSAELVAGLERVGSAHNATLYMVLMAGWQALLARYSGQTDFCVGTSVAHRTRPELDGLIGFFVNTLALRCRLNGNPTFAELVVRVRDEALGAFAHQDVPFEQLVDAVGGERDLSRTPLFQTLFVLLNSDLIQAPSLPGLHVDVLPSATDTARYDLTLAMRARGGELEGQLEYSQDLFTADTARRMVEHLRVLLSAVADGAGSQRLSALTMMEAQERQQVLSTWNATQAAYPVDATVPSLFTEQALRTPQAIAVEHEGRTLTYAELDARSNQLAHHLRSLGLGAESRVGVFLHRGLDLLVGLLGILKAGGAYVPLDASYPAQRLAFMAEDSGVAAILTESSLEDELPAGSQLIVVLDEEWARIERQPSTPVT